MPNIEENLANVGARIRAAENKFARRANSVQLIAVSKTKPLSLVQQAIAAGQKVFGESYAQEAIEKKNALKDEAIEWHFIGPIQSNKTRPLAENFDWIHSVDRLKIAQRLNEQRPKALGPINILLQVNISEEETKAGVAMNELQTLIESVLQMPSLKLRGLMAIPAKSIEPDEQRSAFHRMSLLLAELNEKYETSMDCLSMGMSNDLEAAVAEGATFVRIGTDIFGAREYK